MADNPPQPGRPSKLTAKAAREARLAAALRANLKRRKAAAKETAAGGADKPPQHRKP